MYYALRNYVLVPPLGQKDKTNPSFAGPNIYNWLVYYLNLGLGLRSDKISYNKVKI